MLAHPTNPDLALNLPHLEEKKIQLEVVIMEVEQNKLLYYQSDNSENNGHQVKKFLSLAKKCTPEQIFCKYFFGS